MLLLEFCFSSRVKNHNSNIGAQCCNENTSNKVLLFSKYSFYIKNTIYEMAYFHDNIYKCETPAVKVIFHANIISIDARYDK